MQKHTRFLLSSLLCLSITGTAASALAASNSRALQKNKAEAERAELQQKLKALKTDINKTESAKDQASDALAESEKAISEANRSLRDLQNEQAQTEEKLRQLTEQQQALSAQIEKQKKQLSTFLRRQYMHGDSDRIKLLLSGDNPNRINRDLQYMGYVSQTQAKMIESLRSSLKAAEKNTQDAQEAKAELDEIAEEEKDHKIALEKEKKKHATLVGQLSNKLYAQKKQADNLQKDEQRLSNLVSRLNQLIEEQLKADKQRAEQEEKQRQERIAAQKERAKQAALDKKAGKKPNPNAIDADEPPPKQAKSEAPPAGEFDRLKGQLRLPVKGEILAKFGSKRGDGPSWKGLFIKASEGSEIKAVAAGKVIFADWYKGYGNMIIVGHGDQYMSIYGNNQAVLKHVGDSVKAGDIIASAGNSGGNEESGLYFEIRHQGRAFDPLNWIVVK
ncbi:peptidoglycan DD-metalloendopeptidase family protein [Undibacterium sp. FT147W]|uniref:Peptidoglycan DD-metalloendopeptidase family protein n=1 Tax=Undibacterium rivi TaxID=2828729 RepID=A0ABS5H6F3_9BURK|nr:peptidoglycan DD-metalloendopeptidase family protein [Undibacterium rivi]MBR7794083.1 peptidoglycan DD-metalloendopeptidase family protein [Undibacterium rivi]